MSTYTHPTYGTGTIISSDKAITVVDFGDPIGTKRLVTRMMGGREAVAVAFEAKQEARVASKARKNARYAADAATFAQPRTKAEAAHMIFTGMQRHHGDATRNEAWEAVLKVSMSGSGVAQQVAKSVERSGRCSEKQAAVIASVL